MKSPGPVSKKPLADGKTKFPLNGIWQLGLFAAVHLLIFLALFHYVYKIQYSPAGIYIDFASNVLNGKMPYRDFPFEYPPLSLLFFILPKVFTSTWQTFSTFFQFEVLVFDLIGLYVLYLIARRLGKAPWMMLGAYTAAILAVGPIIEKQYDIFPAVISLLAVYYFWRDKPKTAWVLVGLGTMIKLYPALLAPIFLICYFRNHQYTRLRSGLAAFLTTCLVILLPFLIISPSSLSSLFNYHTQRGIQLESTYGAILLVSQKLGWTSSGLELSFGSWNLNGAAAQLLDKLSIYLMVAGVALALGFIYSQVRAGKSQFSRLGSYFSLIILVVLLTSKILSPQYIIWLVPILPLVFGPGRLFYWLLFFLIGGLTYYLFPLHYFELMAFSTPEVIILFMRNLLLLVMIGTLVFNLRRLKASA